MENSKAKKIFEELAEPILQIYGIAGRARARRDFARHVIAVGSDRMGFSADVVEYAKKFLEDVDARTVRAVV